MIKALAAVALLASAGTAQAANILTNGSFETPGISVSCCNTVVTPNSFLGWNVTAGDINVVNGTFGAASNLAYAGRQYLDLIGESGSGAIEQKFATVLGQVYRLRFAYSHNIFSAPGAAATFNVGTLNGTVSHSTGTNTGLDWRTDGGTFAGTGSMMTLNFTNTVGQNNGGIFLDGVALAAVPEPGTWAMMIGGFGLAGVALRRRRRRQVTVLA
jgi:hypothetical protein